MIRLLLVRDDTLVGQGLRMLLTREPDIIIVGEANNGTEAVSLVQTLQPDIIVIDQVIPDIACIAAIAALCATGSECAIIVISLYDEDTMRTRAQRAGATAFVGKHEGVKVLLDAIHQAGKQRMKLG
jgi:DNA-binding NarL/FixJ family response regulator